MSLPVLNLLNFELPSANKCKYVLTSPRSLKACRKAGVKPIDLLYKSYSDFQTETGKRGDVQILFQAYEKERQRKLALCRAIRNQLLLHGYSIMKEIPEKSERIKTFSPKLHDSKERALPVIRECYLRKRAETPENMRNVKKHVERYPLHLPKVNAAFEHKLANRNIDITDQQKNVLETISCLDTKPVSTSNESVSFVSYENVDKVNEINKLKTQDEVQNVNANEEKHAKISCSYPESTSNRESDKKQVVNDIENEWRNSPKNYDIGYSTKFKEKRPMLHVHLTPTLHRRKARESKRKTKSSEQKKLMQNLKIQYSDPQYCTYKYKQVIENSVDRELKELEVHRVQRELEEGMEKWQDRVLLLQWLDVNRATEQASRELEIKIERLQQKNRTKSIIHTMNINKVKEAEDTKAEDLRRQVEKKERKINSIHQEKERLIYELKSRAISIQDLRDHIRSIMTPETFDQKVAKLGMHKRVLDSHMCARVMQRSHICLG